VVSPPIPQPLTNSGEWLFLCGAGSAGDQIAAPPGRKGAGISVAERGDHRNGQRELRIPFYRQQGDVVKWAKKEGVISRLQCDAGHLKLQLLQQIAYVTCEPAEDTPTSLAQLYSSRRWCR
jgi:hypothetical protein